MKKQILTTILLTLGVWSQAANIYIDPTYKGTSTGSITQPYSTFPAMTSGNKYLLKGGTTLDQTGSNLIYYVDNCIIDSYGTGLATIHGAAYQNAIVYLVGANNKVQNINVTNTNNTVDASTETNGVALIITSGARGYMTNVHVTGGWRGIVAGNYPNFSGTFVFKNCSVRNTQHDGIYICNLDTLLADSINSQNVNLNWANDYGGDCMQVESVNRIFVSNSYFDHSSMNGKYCLICNQYITAKITNSKMIAGLNESSLYIGTKDGVVTTYSATNCILKGGKLNIVNRSDTVYLTNCLLANAVDSSINGGYYGTLTNCTMANSKMGWIGYGAAFHINKCIFVNLPVLIQSNPGDMIGNLNNVYNCGGLANFTNTNLTTLNPQLDTAFASKNSSLSGIGYLPTTVTPVTPPVIIITPNCATNLKNARDSILNITLKVKNARDSIKVLSTAVTSESITINSYKDSVITLKKSLVVANTNYNTLNTTYLALQKADNANLSTISANNLQISNLNTQITNLTKTNSTYTANLKVKNDSLNLARATIKNYNSSVNGLINFK